MSGSSSRRSLAFVVPRFFAGIAGGAETLMSQLAARCAARGDDVEILTTCARDNRTWENAFAPGASVEEGVTVRRFLVAARDLDSWIPRQIAIHEGIKLGIDEELIWMKESVNSPELYSYLSRHASTFDALFFGPYLFGTTFWGSLIAPERSWLIPCLHDEHYAYTDCIASMFRQVGRALFNSTPERDLARARYGEIDGGEVGMGFERISEEELARVAPYFPESFPYLLYLGRKETGKNAHLLVDYFIEAKERRALPESLTLVVAGGGSFDDLHRPQARARGDIIDIAHVTEEQKRSLLKYACALCQPSRNESFGIVLMESWLMRRPVVVHGGCPVTRSFAIRSGGGLYFTSPEEFGGVVSALANDPALASRLGAAGNAFVHQQYSWEAVLERFDAIIDPWIKRRAHSEQSDGQNARIRVEPLGELV